MLVGGLGTPTGGRIKVGQDSDNYTVRDVLLSTRPLVLVHVVTATVVGGAVFGAIGEVRHGTVLAGFVPYAVLALQAYVMRETLHGLGAHSLAVTSELFGLLLQIVAAVVLKVSGGLSLASVYCTMIAALMLQCAMLWKRLRRYVQFSGERRTASLVRFSLPAMVTALGQSFAQRGDRLILGFLTSSAVVGIYGSAASISETLTLISAGVGQVFFRRATMTSGDIPRSRRWAVIGLTALGAVAMVLAAEPLIYISLGPAYLSGIGLVRVLCVAAVPLASYQLDVAILNGLARLRSASICTLAGAGTLAVGCAAAVPQHGAIAAAWSSVAAYSVMAAIARLGVRKSIRNRRVAGELLPENL